MSLIGDKNFASGIKKGSEVIVTYYFENKYVVKNEIFQKRVKNIFTVLKMV